MDRPGDLPPQSHTESLSNVNLCSVFYLKAYLRHTKPVRKKPDGLHVTSLFFLVTIGNTGQSLLKPCLLG